jgi:hypothetical protein
MNNKQYTLLQNPEAFKIKFAVIEQTIFGKFELFVYFRVGQSYTYTRKKLIYAKGMFRTCLTKYHKDYFPDIKAKWAPSLINPANLPPQK